MSDEKVGEIIDALERNNYLKNTVIVFTSDHGDCLTDHGHSQKWTMYDQVTRVPLIVWSPSRFAGGQVVDSLCQQMDLGPTILDLADIAPSPALEAISLMPALKDPTHALRDVVFAEQAQDGILEGTQFMTMVRNKQWKLVHFLDEPYGQLFDLQNDPDEIDNLWDQQTALPIRESMLAVLREWRIRSHLHTADWCQEWR